MSTDCRHAPAACNGTAHYVTKNGPQAERFVFMVTCNENDVIAVASCEYESRL